MEGVAFHSSALSPACVRQEVAMRHYKHKFFKDGQIPAMRVGDWIIVLPQSVMNTEEFTRDWHDATSENGDPDDVTKEAIAVLSHYGSAGLLVARTDDTVTLEGDDQLETYDIDDVVCICVEEAGEG